MKSKSDKNILRFFTIFIMVIAMFAVGVICSQPKTTNMSLLPAEQLNQIDEVTTNMPISNESGATNQIDETTSNTPISNAPYSSWLGSYSQPSGNGSVSSPYLITRGSNLAWIAYQINANNANVIKANIKILNDIYMQSYYWKPIKTFQGVIDGNYKIIKNLYLTSASSTNGCFGFIDTMHGGTIKNLGIDAIYEFDAGTGGASNAVGGLVALTTPDVSDINIQNCWLDGSINIKTTKPNSYIGSIIGYCNSMPQYGFNTTITNCFSKAYVTVTAPSGDVSLGGMVGYMGDATASNTNKSSNVTLDKNIFEGKLFTRNTAKTPKIGALVASVNNGPKPEIATHVIKNSFYSKDNVGDDITAIDGVLDNTLTNVIGMTNAQIVVPANLSTFDFDSVWENEPAQVQDPNRVLYPRLKGFNYPKTIYVVLTFELEGTEFAVRYVQQYYPFDNFPTSFDVPEGKLLVWSNVPKGGTTYYDFNSCAYSAVFVGSYINESSAVTVSIVGYYMKDGVANFIQKIREGIVEAGKGFLKLPNPSISGYTFQGWYDSIDFNTPYDFNEPVIGDANNKFTIYCLFTANIYTISIYYMDKPAPNVARELIKTVSVPHGRTMDFFEAPEKPGYTFDKLYYYYPEYWGEGNEEYYLNFPFNYSNAIMSSNSLYARYTANPVTVIFQYEGVDPDYPNVWRTDLSKELPLHYDDIIPEEQYPELISKEGFDASNTKWMLGEEVWDPETKLTGNITLVARYLRYQYKVTFLYPELLRSVIEAQGKTMTIKEVFIEHGASVSAPSEVEVGNYAGYKRSTPKWDNTDFTNITENRTYIAGFELAKLRIECRAFDELVSTIEVDIGSDFDVADLGEPPRRVGYDQVAPRWDLDGLDFTNITSNIEIRAIYEPNKYNITYVMPDGTKQVITVIHGGSVAQPPTPPTGLFENIVYSKEAKNVTGPMNIIVTIESYAIIVYIVAGGVLLMLALFLIMRAIYRKRMSNITFGMGNRLR